MTFTEYKQELIKTIEHLRSEMVRLALEEGTTDQQTIETSQQLDSYIMLFQRIDNQ